MTVPTRQGHHLSIGEVLASVQDEYPDVTVSKIRFLESQGLIDPERTPSGYRRFYPPDVERLRWILYQQREHFLPLRVIKERLDEFGPSGAPPLAATNGDGPAPAPALPPPPPAARPDPPAPRAAPPRAAPPRAAAPSPPPVARTVRPVEPELTLPLEGLTAPDEVPVVPPEPAPPARSRGRDAKATKPPPETKETPATPPPAASEAPPAGTHGRETLCEEAGVTADALAELEAYGLLGPVAGWGETARYDDDAVEIARAAAPFFARAVHARHLRMYETFTAREAELFAQVLLQYRRQRNPAARARLESELQELAQAGSRLRALMLRRAVREALRE